MVNHFWVLSIFLIFNLQFSLTIAQFEFNDHYCLNNGNYTKNGNYQTTLSTALSSLSSNRTNINYGFYNFSGGGPDPDRVNVIGLCRGDIESNACRSCLDDSGRNLRNLCPNQKETIGWSDNCMIRYANRSILHMNEALPNFYWYNIKNASNSTEFNKVVRSLLDNLRVEAAAGGSMLKYATGSKNTTTETIYGLVQCTPDLSSAQCNDCLNGTFKALPQCCDGKIGGRGVQPSCNFRYEINRFYGQISLPNAPPPQAATPPPQAAAPPPQSGGQTTPPPTSSNPTGGPPPPQAAAPPPQVTAPPPQSGGQTTPPPTSSNPTGGPPPPQQPQGGANKNLAFFGVSTLMAVVLAIFVF